MGLRPSHRRFVLTAALTVALVSSGTRAEQNPASQAPAGHAADFTLAAGGDALVTMRFSKVTDPEFLRVISIIRASDAGFANLETLFHEFQGPAAPDTGGTLLGADPLVAEDLKWAGLSLLGRANNHAGDYGDYGMRRTTDVLDRLGLVHAGVGRTLDEARRPAYLETPKGRVALISCTSTFLPASRAGHARGDVPGRPGVSALRTQRIFKVDSVQVDQLTRIAEQVGVSRPRPDRDGKFMLLGNHFQVAASPGSEWTVDEHDVQEIVASVREARRQADFVIVTIHSHEPSNGSTAPAPFLPPFARASIDAGADAFIGHGPHRLRGVEIYKGRPIFYSLGNLFFQNDAVQALPADFYEQLGLGPEATPADAFDARDATGRGYAATQANFESVLSRVQFHDGYLASVVFYPLTLGFGQPRSRRGRPAIASPADGRRIIDELARLSRPYGTNIEYRDGVGVLEIESRRP
jgi:poly-gamma-glutamate capsule biosynthesis protein CapA/YwtB (metallophosphatase superfamily)